MEVADVELEEIVSIPRHQDATALEGKLELLAIGESAPVQFVDALHVEAEISRDLGDGWGEILVKKVSVVPAVTLSHSS